MTTTHHEYRGYVFSIRYQARQRIYTVEFPDFPDLIAGGRALPEAFANACKGLDRILKSLRKLDMQRPDPKHRLVLEGGLPPCWFSALNRATAN